jgi:hypothetical protein
VTERENVFELVHADLRERERVGTETYGGPLLTFDGRDALWEAYEEALDMAMYLRKAIAERNAGADRSGTRKEEAEVSARVQRVHKITVAGLQAVFWLGAGMFVGKILRLVL